MEPAFVIPGPFQFNPLKHHLSFIKEFISHSLFENQSPDTAHLVRELKHIGTSVMDIYTGFLSVKEIIDESDLFLEVNNLKNDAVFSVWTGIKFNDFRIIALSDTSQWMMKYHNDRNRYVHLFPARLSNHSFRVKANTLKSAVLYNIIIGKDFVSRKDLNRARELLGLSPVKDPAETEAITRLIEILRS